MNLYEAAERYRISVPKLRKMAQDGVLLLDLAEDEELTRIRYTMRSGKHPTALHLCRLVSDPSTLKAMGASQKRAEKYVKALGNVDPAPREVASIVRDCALNYWPAHERLTHWLVSVLPDDEKVNHLWIAVRLLLGLNPAVRVHESRIMRQAMLKYRKYLEIEQPGIGFEVVGGKTYYFKKEAKRWDNL